MESLLFKPLFTVEIPSVRTRIFSLLLVLFCALPGSARATSQAVRAPSQAVIPANGTDSLRIVSIQIANIGAHALVTTTFTGMPIGCQSTRVAAAGSFALDLNQPNAAEMLRLLTLAFLSGRNVTLVVNDGMTSPATCFDWFGTKYPLIASVQIRNN